MIDFWDAPGGPRVPILLSERGRLPGNLKRATRAKERASLKERGDGEVLIQRGSAVRDGRFCASRHAEFTVAGTLAAWAAAGCDVTLVLITSGDVGTHERFFSRRSMARLREKEQREAARILGVKNLIFLRHKDCELQPTIEVRRELVREIRRFQPEVLVCGDPTAWFFEDWYINHPDHRAAGAAALDAVSPCAEMELLWPELGPPHKVRAVFVGMTASPGAWVDITATIETKIRALRAHASQLGGFDPEPMIRQWGRREAERAGLVPKKKGQASRRAFYAEGFRVIRFRER